MKRALTALSAFLILVIVCVIGRMAFYFIHYSLIASGGDDPLFPMLWNGVRLDFCVAGYASIVPFVLLIISTWWRRRRVVTTWHWYFRFVAFAISLAYVANIALYPYWGFPLDNTPLFYIMSSPGDALASISLWQIIVAILVVAASSWCIYFAIEKTARPIDTMLERSGYRIPTTALLVVGTALLILPIRGSITVAPNNVGAVYFSNNMRLNHAAVNPVFSFMVSVIHDEDFSKKYRYLDDAEAASLFAEMIYTEQRDVNNGDSCSLSQLFSPAFVKGVEQKKGLKVVMVILESFSKSIMEEGGNLHGIVPNLEKIASEGLYFSRFYANSFRTDRGLVSILSGYPAQPTMSMMKYPRKTNGIYSISHSLQKAGFATQYIYGGDANFTNMRSYLKATGFESVISEDDYPAYQSTGKWGVDDEYLFTRALTEIERYASEGCSFHVVQTSSSHEPFDVPYSAMQDKVLNAFNYTDKHLGNFVASLKKSEDWDRTLLVIVPDHLGCYPEEIDNFKLSRYEIPLVFTGGAVQKPRVIDTIGSQQDIAATLLTLLGVSHKEFLFSKDLFDSRAPHFAFFTVPDAMGMVTQENSIIFDNTSQKTVLDEGEQPGSNLKRVKAYLQKLYDDIAAR